MALKGDGSIPDEARAKGAPANGKMKRKVSEKDLHQLQGAVSAAGLGQGEG